jgi:Protein of unknown function (DUF1570)
MKIRAWRVGLIGLALVAWAACGSAPMKPQLPSRGGAPWLELKTPHFVIWTDATPEVANELARSLEDRQQVISRAMNRTEQKNRILVFALRSAIELAAFVPPGVLARAWPEINPSYQPGIMLTTDALVPDDEIQNHELAHAVSYALIQNQPRWFAEGLASYFDLATVDPKTRVAQIGVPIASRLQVLLEKGPLPVQQLLECMNAACAMSERFYGSSWALFSYLLNKHFAEFSRYLQTLREIEEQDDRWYDHPPQERNARHIRAWRTAFPTLKLETLDDELFTWVREGSFAVPRIKVEPRPVELAQRTMSEADILAARSFLNSASDQHADSARDANDALALEPTHPMAWAMAMWFERWPSPAQGRAITDAHPQDWRAWQVRLFALRERARTKKEDHEQEIAEVRIQLCTKAAAEGNPCKGFVPPAPAPMTVPVTAPAPKTAP